MRRQNSLCLAFALLFVTPFFAPAARAQSQDAQTDSVAEAARKARAQKKSTDKPVPVITDDILKPSPRPATDQAPAGSAASAGTSTSNSGTALAGQAKTDTANGPESSEDKDKAAAELSGLKEQVAEAQKAFDLAKWQLSLEQDNLYSKPDYQNDSAGKAKVDDLSQQVTDKQQVLDDLKAKLEELQSKADAQTPPAAEPPSPPQV